MPIRFYVSAGTTFFLSHWVQKALDSIILHWSICSTNYITEIKLIFNGSKKFHLPSWNAHFLGPQSCTYSVLNTAKLYFKEVIHYCNFYSETHYLWYLSNFLVDKLTQFSIFSPTLLLIFKDQQQLIIATMDFVCTSFPIKGNAVYYTWVTTKWKVFIICSFE